MLKLNINHWKRKLKHKNKWNVLYERNNYGSGGTSGYSGMIFSVKAENCVLVGERNELFSILTKLVEIVRSFPLICTFRWPFSHFELIVLVASIVSWITEAGPASLRPAFRGQFYAGGFIRVLKLQDDFFSIGSDSIPIKKSNKSASNLEVLVN